VMMTQLRTLVQMMTTTDIVNLRIILKMAKM
jgi:hypothetical protein